MRFANIKITNVFILHGFGGNEPSRGNTECTVRVLGGGEGGLKERDAYSKFVASEGGLERAFTVHTFAFWPPCIPLSVSTMQRPLPEQIKVRVAPEFHFVSIEIPILPVRAQNVTIGRPTYIRANAFENTINCHEPAASLVRTLWIFCAFSMLWKTSLLDISGHNNFTQQHSDREH